MSNRKLPVSSFRLAVTRFDKRDLLGVLSVLSEAGGSIRNQRTRGLRPKNQKPEDRTTELQRAEVRGPVDGRTLTISH